MSRSHFYFFVTDRREEDGEGDEGAEDDKGGMKLEMKGETRLR